MTGLLSVPRNKAFTIIELLVVLTTIGILAGIAVPSYRGVIEKADATVIISDASMIAKAAYQYQAETGSLPPSGAWGSAPAEIEELLPAGFVFEHGQLAVYGWFQWQVLRASSDPLSATWTTDTMAGVLVWSPRTEIIRAVKNQWGGASFGFNNFIILLFQGGA